MTSITYYCFNAIQTGYATSRNAQNAYQLCIAVEIVRSMTGTCGTRLDVKA
jgi:hypothetical protein